MRNTENDLKNARYIRNKREMRNRKRKMRAYIGMAIMCVACLFSFMLGQSVGTRQAEAQSETAVMGSVAGNEIAGGETAEQDQTKEEEGQEQVNEGEEQSDTQEPNPSGSVQPGKENETDNSVRPGNGQDTDAQEEVPKFDTDHIILVNKNHKLPEDYEVNLKTLPDRTNKAAEEAYQPMCDMIKAARKEGLSLEICSSYRSVERQKELFEEDMRALVRKGYSYLDAYDEVARETMPPGYSEHSTGLAFDIVSLGYQMLNAKQAHTAENKWLREHCAEFGFILRYPEDKEDITGISYESWHFRYVGVEIAEYIMEQGLTLEEFLEEQI